MPSDNAIYVDVVIRNAKAVRGLVTAALGLQELADEMPYREDIQRWAKAASYAVKHLTGGES